MMNLKRFLPALIAVLLFGITFTSCDKDATEELDSLTENPSQSENIVFGNAALGQGNGEGMFEDCFTISYPIELNFEDGTTTTINSDTELETAIEAWFTAQGEDAEEPLPTFPISVVLTVDGSTQEIQDEDGLEALFEDCFGDEYDDEDGDYEDDDEYFDLTDCFTINYPIQANLADGTTITVNNDMELEAAMFEHDEEDVEVVYPVSVTLADGTAAEFQSDEDFEDALDACFGDDEDDDDDHDCFDDFDFTDCFTINYPIEIIQVDGTLVVINNDEELMAALGEDEDDEDGDEDDEEDMEDEDDIQVNYPVTVTLTSDGSEQTVNSDEDVEALLEACE